MKDDVPVQILPVIDLKNGVVVHAVGGRREEYRPIQSVLTLSSDPVEVARAFRDRLGLKALYIADLDAIAGNPPAWTIYREIRDLGLCLWVDAGIRTLDSAMSLAHAAEKIIIGLETVGGPAELAAICKELGSRAVFSLDLKEGKPLRRMESWQTSDPLEIAGHAIAAGVKTLIVLDLARVGTNAGVGVEALCRRLKARYPAIELLAGGGIRSMSDVAELGQCGVSGVLVASALHTGQISGDDIAEVTN